VFRAADGHSAPRRLRPPPYHVTVALSRRKTVTATVPATATPTAAGATATLVAPAFIRVPAFAAAPRGPP
jgi:hypothetical protein